MITRTFEPGIATSWKNIWISLSYLGSDRSQGMFKASTLCATTKATGSATRSGSFGRNLTAHFCPAFTVGESDTGFAARPRE